MLMLSGGLSLVVGLVALLLGKKTFSDTQKTSSFECGYDTLKHTRAPFSLRFFKVAILFLIFDVEIVLLLPLPLISSSSGIFFSASKMVIFIILGGLIYEWNQGALKWLY